MVNAILIDSRNFEGWKAQICSEIQNSRLIGFDLETHNENAHEGIKKMRKGNRNKVVFDWRNKIITGASIYPDQSENCYYFNLEHADLEYTLKPSDLIDILDSKGEGSYFVCHNAPYEITVMHNTFCYDLRDVLCSMQLAVTAFGPDEYDMQDYIKARLGSIPDLFHKAAIVFNPENVNSSIELDLDEGYEVQDDEEEVEGEPEIEEDINSLTPAQTELLNKIIGKQSRASFSYNGLVNSISYSYGLKKLVKKLFNVDMMTYEETLGGKKHMGELTGPEVVKYGCDDSYYAVLVFRKIWANMSEDKKNTYLEQENPMINVYSEARISGLRINKEAVEDRTNFERREFAQKLREFKEIGRRLLPFKEKLNPELLKLEKWYVKSGEKYRKKIEDFLNSDSPEDDFEMVCQISNAVSNGWANKKLDKLSLTHYYPARIFYYDLCGLKPIVVKKKVMSNDEARGSLLKKAQGDSAEFIKKMAELVSIEQRMKLYLTPYAMLVDPDTDRLYPEISSTLASRRMAASNPNPMQLAKRGASTYVRGFYLPDSDEEVLVSLDWSQVELVIIGELSGDPQFKEAYGQLPYKDLHSGAAANLLGLDEEIFNNLEFLEESEIPPHVLLTPEGVRLDPKSAKKFWRTELGKGANFNYWYSGALSTIASRMGWNSEKMWEAVDRYRNRFYVAENWRQTVRNIGRDTGRVTLPDKLERYKFEATNTWMDLTRQMFSNYNNRAIALLGQEVIRAVSTRAGNQLVNSLVQGTSATLSKRSILAINKAVEELDIRARFKLPVHDELVFSVHKSDVLKFISLAKELMCNHPDIITNLKLHVTASVGNTFEPYHKEKAPFGQIELDECPALDIISPELYGKELDNENITKVLNYLDEDKKLARCREVF